MNKALLRTGGIIASFIVGYCLPGLHLFEGMIRWLIVTMLFITFLKVRFDRLRVRWQHIALIAANLAIALSAWQILVRAGYPLLGVMAFFVGITPTATAAPVIMGFLKGNVEFMVTSLITSTLGIGLLLPLLMSWVTGASEPGVVWDMARSVGIVLGLPLLAALAVRRLYAGGVAKLAVRLGAVQFPIWILALLLISGSGSHFIRSHGEISSFVFLQMALLSLVICVVNFLLGYWIGRPSLKRECSQSLGQKNTTLTIYLAMAYASPLAALAVTFYVVFHNIWNAVQIHLQGRKDALSARLEEKEEEVVFREGS